MLVRSVGRLLSFVKVSGPVRGLKSDLPPSVKWVRPEKGSCTLPVNSGDLEPAPLPPRDSLNPRHAVAPAIDAVPPEVKRLFSVGFVGEGSVAKAAVRALVDRVKRHPYDADSAEVKIARMTGQIRSMQIHLARSPRDGATVRVCKLLIDKRKKMLKFLRRRDYRRFEWILEKLNLEYKPEPLEPHRVTRKDSLRKLTRLYCDNIRTTRTEAYRVELENKREKLLKFHAENPLPQPNYKHHFRFE